MRRLLLTLLLLLIAVPFVSANGNDLRCSAEMLNAEINAAIDAFYADQATATDSEALENTANLQSILDDIVTNCQESSSSAMPAVNTLTSGKWYLQWETDYLHCDGQMGVIAPNRYVVIDFDPIRNEIHFGDTLAVGDVVLEDVGDAFQYLRQEHTSTVHRTFAYRILDFDATTITGEAVITVAENTDCVLTFPFTMELIAEGVSCILSTRVAEGAYTTMPVSEINEFEHYMTFNVTGQHTDEDGYLWWKVDNNFFRADTVVEAGDCSAVPTVE